MFAHIATIDGPPASGKTTMARMIAQEFGMTHVDSGAIFRAITLHCMNHGINLQSSEAVIRELHNIKPHLTGERVFLKGTDVSELIRTAEVTNNVCHISHLSPVRDFVKEVQLSHAKSGSVVCDGRKVGKEVFPNAEVKFYLTASPQVRAHRRFLQYREKDPNVRFDDVYRDLMAREEKEVTNGILLMPENAIVIDNSHLSIADTFNFMEYYLLNT